MPSAAVVSAPPAASATPVEAKHLYWIDWLRFLAAALVLLDHVCGLAWPGQGILVDPRYFKYVALLFVPIHLGRQAVVVFFVLSGALVGGLTLRKVRAGTFDARGYAADRLARVYVPLIPALLLTAASVRLLDDSLAPSAYLGCLFGVQRIVTDSPHANPVLWTLAYEVWFYVLGGCAAVVATPQNRPVGARLAALAGCVLAIYLLCCQLAWVYLACWLLGAAGFWLTRRIARFARGGTLSAGLVLMAAGALASQPDLLLLYPSLAWLSRSPALPSGAILTLAVGTWLVFATVSRWAPKWPAVSRLERLGTPLAAFSYTLYLTHFPVAWMLVNMSEPGQTMLTWHSLVRVGWWLAVCLLVAVVMYGLFERRTPRVRRWLRARLGGRRRAEAPPYTLGAAAA